MKTWEMIELKVTMIPSTKGHAKRSYAGSQVRHNPTNTVHTLYPTEEKTYSAHMRTLYRAGLEGQELLDVTKGGRAISVDHSGTVPAELRNTYRCWQSMLNRCFNPNYNRKTGAYYGRVAVEDSWCPGGRPTTDGTAGERFYAFHEYVFDLHDHHVPAAPRPGETADRIDPRGHYVPKNFRWADRVLQARNKRRAGDGMLMHPVPSHAIKAKV